MKHVRVQQPEETAAEPGPQRDARLRRRRDRRVVQRQALHRRAQSLALGVVLIPLLHSWGVSSIWGYNEGLCSLHYSTHGGCQYFGLYETMLADHYTLISH
jgi:hypothetical protein